MPDAPCIRCDHPEFVHDDEGCEFQGCACLGYRSETDELEDAFASDEGPEELELGEDG